MKDYNGALTARRCYKLEWEKHTQTLLFSYCGEQHDQKGEETLSGDHVKF